MTRLKLAFALTIAVFMLAALSTTKALADGNPTIQTITPTFGKPGDQIIISGKDFGTTQGKVRFQSGTAAVQSAVLNWSDTSIRSQIPQLQTNQAYYVRLTTISGLSNNKFYVVSAGPKPPSCPDCANINFPTYTDPYSYREFIFFAFGFTTQAVTTIRDASNFVVNANDPNCNGGGTTYFEQPFRATILCYNRQATVHELSHVFWHGKRQDKTRRLWLIKDLIKLANLNKNQSPQYAAAIDFAHVYVYGEGAWKGMFCSPDQKTCVGKDPKLLTDDEIINYTQSGAIIDFEIYSGLASWTMGKIYFNETRRLPAFMARHLAEEFTNNVKAVPYYEGGPL